MGATLGALRRRRETPEAIEWTLPADLLLEIVARSDTRTLVRCAAACKLLRRDILSPHFIRSVSRRGGIVPPWIVAYLNTHHGNNKEGHSSSSTPLSLLHPDTPAAASFVNHHLSSRVSRFADDLLGEHYPLTSRGGLFLLRRRSLSSSLSNLCVYDPITGDRTFLSDPPDVGSSNLEEWFDRCLMLTATDGIGCSFMLFATHLGPMPEGGYARAIRFQTATSTCSTWAPAVTRGDCSGYRFNWQGMRRDTVVLQGGVVHWLHRWRGDIIFYNVCTTEMGRIKLPSPIIGFQGPLHLGSYTNSQHGKKLLRLLAAHRFKISVWHQLPGGDWASEAVVIDTEEKVRSLDPDVPPTRPVRIDFWCSGEGSNIMLLHINRKLPKSQNGRRTLPVILVGDNLALIT